MELARCLRPGNQPTLPFSIHPTKLSLDHSSLSLSRASSSRLQRCVCRPVIILAAERSFLPSTNDRDSNKIGRGTLGASLVLACALGVMGCCSTKMVNHKAIAWTIQERPPMADARSTPTTPKHPVEDAVKSFFEVIEHLATQEADHSNYRWPRLHRHPSATDINIFKKEMLKLIKSGKGKEAITRLQKEYEINKDFRESAFNLEIALVEIYISQGKYKVALECNCLKDDHKSSFDKRIPLYKAIAHTMLAKQFWEELTEDIGGLPEQRPSRNITIN